VSCRSVTTTPQTTYEFVCHSLNLTCHSIRPIQPSKNDTPTDASRIARPPHPPHGLFGVGVRVRRPLRCGRASPYVLPTRQREDLVRAKFGARSVTASDKNPLAVDLAKTNARENGVQDVVSCQNIEWGVHDEPQGGGFDVVLACEFKMTNDGGLTDYREEVHTAAQQLGPGKEACIILCLRVQTRTGWGVAKNAAIHHGLHYEVLDMEGLCTSFPTRLNLSQSKPKLRNRSIHFAGKRLQEMNCACLVMGRTIEGVHRVVVGLRKDAQTVAGSAAAGTARQDTPYCLDTAWHSIRHLSNGTCASTYRHHGPE